MADNDIFMSSRWFSPYISSVEMEAKMKGEEYAGKDGVFGVRVSKSNPSDFVLSVWRNNAMTNIKILNHGDYYDPSIGEKFASLSDLVSYFYKNPNELKEKNGDWIHLRYPLNFDEPTEERWFHGSISSVQAEKLLQDSKADGSFLVRRSASKMGSYVISALVKQDVFHIMVHCTENKYHLQGGEKFVSLEALIEHYKKWSMVDNSGVVVSLTTALNSTRVNLSSFKKRKDALESSGVGEKKKDGFTEEFEYLQQQEMRQTKDRKQGQRVENKAKNRYKNILPYDESRVKLQIGKEEDGSDYINANWVRIPDNPNTYIATQGTLSTTAKDFWQMVWETKAIVIFMVTKEVERGKNKCYRYWPTNTAEPDTYGNITVKLDSETHDDTFIIRRMTITHIKQPRDKRSLLHYQYVAWPDHGVPKDPAPCIDGINNIGRELDIHESRHKHRPPIIVHCSAGIGRTGTVIVLDCLINLIDKYGICVDVDVQRSISQIREKRSGMVQTAAQYKFIYDALLRYMEYYRAKEKAAAENCQSEYGNISSLH
ncbi:tyrosine-protein phosphatase corkscrew-like [Bolinopsis microptera]|uniref:tyrosine-protein phosphatase corkscrew-like n=1 Tax=Bolinopsis microptera TaxID=2820187 RepID=UPI00307A6D8F